MKTLRPYQESAINGLFDYLFSQSGQPLVVAPVGSGKSLLIAEFIKRVHAQWPRTRIVMLSHVKELLEQDAAELRLQYPECDFGFYCASLGQKRLHNDVTFASIQSVWNKVNAFNRCPEIIICDECHLISHNDQTQYRKFIDAVMAINPNAKIIGFTGTPFRSDTGRLDEGEGRLFDGIAYEIDIGWMIEEGYLCRPVTPRIAAKMNVDGVKSRGGDYIAGQLEKAVDIDETTQACVNEIIEKGAGRNKWLVFTAGIQHCEHVFEAIKARGISCDMIVGDTDTKQRDEVIARFKRGEIRCLVNVAVLTTGFNVPDIDMLAFMRPTKSPVLYIQTTGRGIRPVYANGYDLNTKQGRLDAISNSKKPDCLILDFGGVIENLGPIDSVDIRKKNKAKDPDAPKGQAIIKRCPSCGEICAAAQRFCYVCSYSFISDALNTKSEDHNAILSSDEPIEERAVIGMNLDKHYKGGDINSKPTLCVSYVTMTGVYKDWICFEHIGYARDKAIHWHKQMMKDMPPPSTIDEALTWGYNDMPKKVLIRKEGKYYRVKGISFDDVLNVSNSTSLEEEQESDVWNDYKNEIAF